MITEKNIESYINQIKSITPEQLADAKIESGLQVIIDSVLKGVPCEVCRGKGHTVGACPTKKRIDQIVKGLPDVRDSWREYKLNKMVQNLNLKKQQQVYKRVSYARKNLRLGRKRHRATIVSNELEIVTEEMSEIDRSTHYSG